MICIAEILVSETVNNGRLDAEFFHPKYRSLNEILNKISNIDKIGHLTYWVKKGIFDISPTRYQKEGIPLIRTTQIKEIISCENDLVFISEGEHNKYFSKTELAKGDIVFTKIGAGIGDTAILNEKFDKYNFSQNVAGISVKRHKIDPYYLIVFLNTKYGKEQIIRYMMPSGQGKLELKDIKKIRVPRLNEFEKSISDIFKKVIELNSRAKNFYNYAQHLLEQELDIYNIEFKKPISYESTLSDIIEEKRADAEFFDIKYTTLLNRINSYSNGVKTLNKVTDLIAPNFEPNKFPEMEFNYIEIGNINIFDGFYSQNKIKGKNAPANAKIKLSGGEIIISQVRPTRGAISIIDDKLDNLTVCSGAFYVCRVKDNNFREAIWMYLRCVRQLFEKYCGGTSYPTIESYYISKFPVLNFNKKCALKIKNLINRSRRYNKEANILIEQAKLRVEELVEQTPIKN